MSLALTQAIQTQIDDQRIKIKFIFKINSADRSVYLLSWNLSYDRSFGAASGRFTLNNNGDVFGEGGDFQIYVGDLIEFSEKYEGDVTEFKKFYGVVEQRSIEQSGDSRNITLTCLDYIGILQKTDADLVVEGTKVGVEEETLTPNFLPAPNNNLAQIFNFANDGLADQPRPLITIRPKVGQTTLVSETPQYDGFEIRYAEGQLVLGTPLNVGDNYDVVATSYFFYTQGVYVEDVYESLLTQPNGYGKYLFDELTAQAVIDNHLKDTFLNVEGTTEDYMTPNYVAETIKIKTQLSVAYSTGDSVLHLNSTGGFPDSGTGEINGDLFTWSSKGSGNTLEGVTSLGSHPVESYCTYEEEYEAGRVWYLTYSNVTSTMVAGEFSGLGIANVSYIDYRYGRIILDSAISLASIVKHNGDYTFKTLQATGVELNKIAFRAREMDSIFDCIEKVRKYTAPNYIIRTIGDDKIWANYLTQKVNSDYDLTLTQNMTTMEDEDLYTRVKFYGKNINPTNIVLGEDVDFTDTGVEYKATAVLTELQWEREEGNYQVYKTTITDAGTIDPLILIPVVYLNDVPVDNQTHLISQMPVVIAVTQRTETIVIPRFLKSPKVEVHQYWYYKIKFAHTSIDPNYPIYCYDATGTLVFTISAGDGNMDYGNGIYNVPGAEQNSTIESISTASYNVFYSTTGIDIDYANIRFKISKQLVPTYTLVTVRATFQYWTMLTPFDGLVAVIDGRFETQVQTIFYGEPPTGLQYAILDLGQIYEIQAFDMVCGFFRPDGLRKYDVDFRFTLKYSTDGVNFYNISDETTNIQLASGDHVSFEEDQLGIGFQARYILVVLEDVKKIDYGENGVWVVAVSELSVYNDIILKSEATLIPTTVLTEDVIVSDKDSSGLYPVTVTVDSTEDFTEPGSGEVATAYIGEDSFTYTGLLSTQFLGVEGLSEDHYIGDRVSQTLENDTSMYDDSGLLPKLGDRLYKRISISDDTLYTQAQLDTVSMAYLQEFYKNHTKKQIDILYAPYLQIGQTIDIDGTNYFIESISDNNGMYNITVGRYPG